MPGRTTSRPRGQIFACATAAISIAVSSAPASARAWQRVATHRIDGRSFRSFTLSNESGLELEVLEWGATLYALRLPDRGGRPVDILVHPGTIAATVLGTRRYGRTVGRFAGRLSGGFELNARHYRLASNADGVTLHGGDPGLDAQIWQGRLFETASAVGVVFRLESPDGFQGFPGALDITATYSLSRRLDRLSIIYHATTNRPTYLNLSNHAFFNLSGSGDVLDHRLTIPADRFVALDDRRLPTGRLPRVSGTALDFRRNPKLHRPIEAADPLVAPFHGLDRSFVMPDGARAVLSDPRSGRELRLVSDQPALQVFSANSFDGSDRDAHCVPIGRHAGIALETGALPDAPNIRGFGATIVRPGKPYHAVTTLTFEGSPAQRP